jgi:CDP-diacylglycerol--serine O-phosphatidyltransferase
VNCFHPSNLLTYGSLLSSVAAIAFAAQGRAGLAGALIALAVILDSFDGRYARTFARSENQRAIGEQLDSLSDAIAFGAAPAMCVVALRLTDVDRAAPFMDVAWWMSVCAFVACAITRLAFFNVTHAHTTGFIGLPAPVAALLWSTVLLVNPGIAASALVFAVAAAAMVMPFRIPRPTGLAFAAFLAWPLLVIAAHLR